MARRTVIYHADCVDGFTAAWVCHMEWPDAEFVAARYGDAPPRVAGRDVVIVDFSYPREILIEMQEAASSLRVLDHHKTAAEALAGLDFAVFDMTRSGAGLAWDTFCAPAARPALVNYVEDRDLWRWALPESKAVSAYIALRDRTFRCWSALATELESIDTVIERGHVALQVVDQYVDSRAMRHRVAMIGGYWVPCINTTFAVSELVGELSEGFPFAAGWFERTDGKLVYSLRSRGDGIDVSEIAKQYGGGGHRNAAGFTVDRPIHWENDE